MNTEIITIGDEILIGQVADTNSAWIASKLIQFGLPVRQFTTVTDEREHILQALKDASGRSDLIIVTGGLGPTKDDITKQTICSFFNTRLVLNEPILQHIKTLFSSRNLRMPDINIKQAEIPESCIPVINNFGTAPGMWFEQSAPGKADAKSPQIFIFMPGVPYEMEAMMESDILPRLKSKFKTAFIVQKTIITRGIGESALMEIIQNWEEDLYAKGMKLAYLPAFGTVRLRITLSGYNKELLEENINIKILELKSLVPENFIGEEGALTEELLGPILREKKLTLSTAESCTGGYLAHLLTSIPGSSDYYIGSVISYSNTIKIDELNVNKADIEQFGAVSKEVVEAMASGIRKKYNTDYAIATSGIAGPTGGTEEKPVGTVWIAISGPEKTFSKKFLFGKSRVKNIRQSAIMALNMLYKELSK